MRRWHPLHSVSRLSAAAAAAAVLVLGAGGGIAYAYFSASGSGSGAALTGTLVSVTATAGTPTSPLRPGTKGDVAFRVSNPNGYPVLLTTVVETGDAVTVTSTHSSCSTTDGSPVVTVAVPSADPSVTVPGNATTYAVDLATAATMDVTANNACQGATFSVSLTLTVHTT